MSYEVKEVLDIKAELGECPVWSVKEQCLYFVDILKPAIYRFDPATGALTTYRMPEHIGCFGFREQGGFIAAKRSGVYLLDQAGRMEAKIAANPTDQTKSRFNDGGVDPWGRFWCGTMWEADDEEPNAQIFRMDSRHNSPRGETVGEIILPVPKPTMVTFGGPELKTLYITSARENMSAEELQKYPQSGGLFAVELEVAGNPAALYKG